MYYHFLCHWVQWAKVLLQMPVSMSSFVFLVPLSDLDNLLICIRKYSFSVFRKEYYIIAMISSLGILFGEVILIESLVFDAWLLSCIIF